MSTQRDVMRDRLLAQYGVVRELPEVTTTAMTDYEDQPVRRGRPEKPPLRQIPPTSETVTRSLSWWEKTDRVGFTARAEEQLERMRSSREAGQVSGANGV